MNSGIKPNSEATEFFNTNLKLNPKVRGMILKLDTSGDSLVSEKVLEKDFQYKDLVADHTYLPQKDAR